MPGMMSTMAVRVAEDYPFDLPDGSYLLRGGQQLPLTEIGRDRLPLLAIGSNGAPTRLARKLAASPDEVPVTRAVLHDYAVVYSAHFASYGSLPATVVPHAGSACWVFVTWLTPAQLELLHLSEGQGAAYDLVELNEARVEDEVMGRLGSVAGYRSRAGAMLHEREPIRVAEIPTTGCALPALTQRAALRWVHRRLAPLLDYAAFLRRLIEDASFRRATNVALRQLAAPVAAGGWTAALST
jgi:hypothetical protein